jgi:ABC-type glycerol-3-phosphate transport system substrate-binding protein
MARTTFTLQKSRPTNPPGGALRPTRRRLCLTWTGALSGSLALASCGVPWQRTAAGPAGKLPDQPVTLQVGWEAPTNLLSQFEQGTGKELFEQRHPTVKLEFSTLDTNDITKMTALAAGGAFPDVLLVGNPLVPVVAERGFCQPLDPFYSRQRGFKDDFAPNMWEMCSYQGKTYMLLRGAGPMVLFCNLRVFGQAGVPSPSDDWDWEQWRQASSRLIVHQDDPSTWRWGTTLPAWFTWVWSNGGEILSKDLKTSTMDQPAAIEGLQTMQDFSHRYKVAAPPGTPGLQPPLAMFQAGRLAMLLGTRAVGTNNPQILEGLKEGWVALTPLPRGKAGRQQGAPGNGIAMGATTRWPEAAWRAIDWFGGTEFQKLQYANGVGGVVARRSVSSSPEYLNSVMAPKWNQYFVQGQRDLRAWPPTPKWTEVNAMVNEDLGPLNRGEQNARQVVTNLVPKVNALLRT